MAQLALYRAYRPKDFNDVYGQDHIVHVLANAVKENSFSHAYLFCGPRGTGKTSVARILARAINCEKPKEGNPDNLCPKCQLINDNNSLDIIEIDAASHTQVDNIREVIIERTHFAPTNLKYKVYIIDEAHMLSKSSFNALLKTLEEPPEHAIFILATTEISKIPSTIISRCQRFDFKRIANLDLEKRLKYIADQEKIKINAKAITLIAKTSEGGFRDAISFLDQVSASNKTEISEKEIEAILGSSDVSSVEDYIFSLSEKRTEKGLEIIRKVVEEGHDIGQFYKNLVDYLRKLMLASVVGVSEVDFSVESSKRAVEVLKSLNLDKIVFSIDTLMENEQLYRYASLPQLGLEVATIKICQTDKEKTIVGQPAEKKKEGPKKEKEHFDDSVIISAPAAGSDSPNNLTEGSKKDKETQTKPNGAEPMLKWQQLLMEIKSVNNSIHAFLKVCEPEFEGQSVCLYFPYKFHKERIEDIKNRRIVEEGLKRVYNTDYKVKCVIRSNGNNHPPPPIKDDLLEDALEIFGGEVIE